MKVKVERGRIAEKCCACCAVALPTTPQMCVLYPLLSPLSLFSFLCSLSLLLFPFLILRLFFYSTRLSPLPHIKKRIIQIITLLSENLYLDYTDCLSVQCCALELRNILGENVLLTHSVYYKLITRRIREEILISEDMEGISEA
jgi:hypothetical protein